MRTHKLGSRLLRVVTPDGKVRYFKSAPGFASLRLFWIFRNFATLNDSVLTMDEHALIRQIYRTGEVPKAAVDPTKVLGTLEVSSRSGAHEWAASARVIQLAIVPPPNADRQSPGKLWRLALNSAGAAGVFLFIVGLLGNRDVRQQPATYASSPAIAASSRPQPPVQAREARQANSAKSAVADEAPQAPALQYSSNVPDKASIAGDELSSISEATDGDLSPDGTADLQPASSVSASSSGSVSKPIQSSVSSNLSTIPSAEELPSSGPPQTHPVLADFSPISQDTEVILRAIVSADGSVTKVKVLAGKSQVAREAARAVASWRYTPRSSRGNAESLIAFRFLAPDTVSVSFLDSAAPDARR